MLEKRVPSLLCALLVSGCAIHPLPEDFAAVSTVQIVRQIRCEAQTSLRNIITDRLERIAHPDTRRLAQLYRQDPEFTRNFSPDIFKAPELDDLRSVVKLFYGTAIAYNFDFDLTEDNDVGAGIDILKPFTNSKLAAGFSLSANRKRENHRSFTVSDTFKTLLNLPFTYCNGQQVEENFAYPIAGRIGIEPVLRDFIALTLFGGLAPKDGSTSQDAAAAPKHGTAARKKPARDPGAATISGPPTLAEMLSFTTTVSASLSPKITFSPVGSALQVSDATLTGTVDRMDMHKVTLGLAVATGDVVDLDPVRTQFFGGRAGDLIAGRRVTGGGTPSQQLAVIAIDQFKRGRVDDPD